MAIGTALAVGLGATALGGALGAKSQKKAAKRAAQISADTAAQNNALAQSVYTADRGALGPYAQAGNPAGGQINALLGLGGTPAAGADAVNPQQAAASAFDQFRNSTGYQFRLNEGMNALNSGLASSGVLQSGAAMRAAQEYGQNFASNEFGNYMGMLDNQQRLGLSATLGQVGLGQNYVGTITANSNNAGTNAANAALIRGQSNPFASALGALGGSVLSGGLKF